MFAAGGSAGSRMLSVAQTASADVRSRATVTRSGEVHVVLINDGLTSGHTVLIRPPLARATPSSSVYGRRARRPPTT